MVSRRLEAYASTSVAKWLASKGMGALTMLALHVPPILVGYTQGIQSVAGALRLSDFLSPIAGLRFLLVGVAIAMAARASRGAEPGDTSSAAARCARVGLQGLATGLGAYWSVHITHTQSYFTVACLHLSGLFALLWLPRLLGTALATLQGAYVSWVWLIEPLELSARYEWGVVLLVLPVAAACVPAIGALSAAMCESGRHGASSQPLVTSDGLERGPSLAEEPRRVQEIGARAGQEVTLLR